MDELERLKRESWVCEGPDRVGGFAGTNPAVGKQVNYIQCMMRPDCSCERFQKQADRILELEEKLVHGTDMQEMSYMLKEIGYQKPSDLYIVWPMPSKLKDFLRTHVHEDVLNIFWQTDGMYFCGGLIRAYFAEEPVRDVDIYFNSLSTFEKVLQKLENAGFRKIVSTDRAITLTKDDRLPPVQLIHFITGEAHEILNEFDFTIIKACCTNQKLYLHENFRTDLKNKVLHYAESRLPISSLDRAFKYARRGYHLPAVDLLSIIVDIYAKVDLTDEEDVKRHLEPFDPQQ